MSVLVRDSEFVAEEDDSVKVWVLRGNDSPKKALEKKLHPTFEVIQCLLGGWCSLLRVPHRCLFGSIDRLELAMRLLALAEVGFLTNIENCARD